MSGGRFASAALTVAAAVLVLAGCTSTVPGSAVRATGGPGAGAVDPSSLNVGNYPTKPAALGVAGDERTGRIVEAQRMSNWVTGAWEADPSLLDFYLNSALVLADTSKLKLMISSAAQKIADRHGMVNGYFTVRGDGDRKELTNAVLRFPDAEAANAAASEMGGAAAQPDEDRLTTGLTATAIPGHPDAKAAVGTSEDSRRKLTWQVMHAFTAHGPYVLMQQAQTSDGNRDAIAGLIARTLDLQAPLIDRFPATPVPDLPNLPIDPTRLLSRTLPIDVKDAQLYQRTVYEPRGALQLQDDPVSSARLFTETGVDLVATGRTTVYQARDAAGAARVVRTFADQVGKDASPADGVPGLPGSTCMRLKSSQSFYCVASADRYAIETSGGQLPNAQQQMAAQYVMLTTS